MRSPIQVVNHEVSGVNADSDQQCSVDVDQKCDSHIETRSVDIDKKQCQHLSKKLKIPISNTPELHRLYMCACACACACALDNHARARARARVRTRARAAAWAWARARAWNAGAGVGIVSPGCVAGLRSLLEIRQNKHESFL